MEKEYTDNKPSEVVLLCASYEDTTWYYSTKNKNINRDITYISESPTIHFNPVKINRTGYYYCYGSYSSNHTFIAVTRLRAYGKYSIDIHIEPSFFNCSLDELL